MTNRERYQRTFSVLHASQEALKEVYHMKRTKIFHPGRALLAAALAAAALSVSAFAANEVTDGQFFQNITLLLNGQQVEAVYTGEDANGRHYTIQAADADAAYEYEIITDSDPESALSQLQVERSENADSSASQEDTLVISDDAG